MDRSFYKLLSKIVLLIVMLVIVDKSVGVGFGLLRQKALECHPHNIAMKTPFMVEKVNTDIVIVGASDASHHYVPKMIADSLDMTVYNCGQDGCFFIYQNCLINLMLERFSPKVIIWEMMEDCLSTNMDAKYEFQSINGLYPYYYDLFCRKVINGKDKKQRYLMISQMFRENSKLYGYLNSLLKNQKLDSGYVPIDTLGYKFPVLSTDQVPQNINSDKAAMLESTIKLCRKHNVNLIIASSPSYSDNYIKNTVQYKKLKSIADDSSIPFIDSFDNEKAFRDSSLFKDVNHMNERGSKLYMKWFIPQLKKYL